jgi:uncharacterized membrane protein YhaH (DUF805 family)
MEQRVNPLIAATKDGLLRFADFSGTSSRAQYWYFFLAVNLSTFTIAVIAGEMVGNLISYILILPSLSIAVRRIRDTGRNPFFVLVPFYNLYLLLQPSQTNNFSN